MDVSVVIPTRNRPEMLKRALSSIERQKGKASLQILVADDGDPSQADRVREAVESCNGIYLSSGGGRGGGFARNLGIKRSDGELIAFLDDDDAWTEDKIIRQCDLMNDQSIAMSYTATLITHRNGKGRYSFRRPKYEDHFRSIMKSNFIGTISTVMVRRSALTEIGGFDPELPALQDYDLYIRLLRRFRTGWIESPLTIYYNDDAAADKVSGSRLRFIEARRRLLIKYRDEVHYTALCRSLRWIEVLKCVRSRRFLFDTLRALITGRL